MKKEHKQQNEECHLQLCSLLLECSVTSSDDIPRWNARKLLIAMRHGGFHPESCPGAKNGKGTMSWREQQERRRQIVMLLLL